MKQEVVLKKVPEALGAKALKKHWEKISEGEMGGLYIFPDIFPDEKTSIAQFDNLLSERPQTAIAVGFLGEGEMRIAGVAAGQTGFDTLKNKCEALDAQFLHDVCSAKSRTIGCKECGSQISREHLTVLACPVCKGGLYTQTQIKRLNVLDKKRDESLNALCKIKEKILKDGTKKLNWILAFPC